MTHRSFKLRLATILSLITLLASVQFAQAASVSWSGTDEVYLSNSVMPNYRYIPPTHYGDDVWFVALINPSVSVRYSSDVVDSEGLSLCGGTIPLGSTFVARFAKHTPEDVVWLVTGGYWDTPYGSWAENAEIADVACRPEERVSYFITDMWGHIQLFTPFVANPPQKSLEYSNGLITCDTSTVAQTGEARCRAEKAGNANISFNFDETYGKFYFRTQHTNGLNRAGTAPAPSCTGYLPSSPYYGDSNTGKAYLELFSTGDYEPMRRPQGTYGHGMWDPVLGLYYAGYVANNPTMADFPSALNKSDPYQFRIPPQSITCPITIVPPIGAPSAPTVTSTSCAVGTSLELAFSSTDPNGHRLRFGVDWDDDGTVDQFVPPSGYVPSGSEQSAKRMFAIPGEKHVAVMVENDRGARSEWTHYSFNCAEAPEEDDTSDNDNIPPQECPIGYEYQGGACIFVSCPVGYVKQGTACIFQGCPVGYTLQNGACIWTGCPEGFLQQGSQCVLENQCTSLPYCQGYDLRNGCTHELIQVCQWGCTSGACKGVPSPTAALSASPAVVIKGKTTKLSWNSANTASCTVTGTNGDSFTGLSAINKVSGKMNVMTTFTLHCDGHDGSSPAFIEKKVTVTVRPDYEEK